MARRMAIVMAAAVALAGCGGTEGEREAASRAAANPSVELPPLPSRRAARVVEPAAGEVGPADAGAPATATGTAGEAKDPKPTAPASAGARRRSVPPGIGSDTHTATALPNGIALPPLEAPSEVLAVIEGGNVIARSPYKWGGGHGRFLDDGYDCSGSVSFALYAAGLIEGPRTSGALMSWGEPGKGRWITIYTHPGHVFMEVAGIRFDTSGARVTGSRWQNAMRSTSGFTVRHPRGL